MSHENISLIEARLTPSEVFRLGAAEAQRQAALLAPPRLVKARVGAAWRRREPELDSAPAKQAGPAPSPAAEMRAAA